MAYSLNQIINRAMLAAVGTGTDAHSSPVIDNKFVAETLFPHALRDAAIDLVRRDAGEAANLKRTYALTLTDGVATLPTTVLPEFLKMSEITSDDDADVGELSSYVPRYSDYLRPSYSQLGYYTVNGTEFCYREPNGDADSFDGDINLITVGLPDTPATASAAITISENLAKKTIEILALMIKGELALA